MNSTDVFHAAVASHLVRDEQARLTVGKSISPFTGYFVTVDLEYRHMGHPMSLFGVSKVNALIIAVPRSADALYEALIDSKRDCTELEIARQLMQHPHAVCVFKDDVVLDREAMYELDELLSIPVATEMKAQQVFSGQFENFTQHIKQSFKHIDPFGIAETVHEHWQSYLGNQHKMPSMAM